MMIPFASNSEKTMGQSPVRRAMLRRYSSPNPTTEPVKTIFSTSRSSERDAAKVPITRAAE